MKVSSWGLLLPSLAAMASFITPGAAMPWTTRSAAIEQRSGQLQGRDMACNNSPLLCDRTYDNVTHMGAHNSAFLRDDSTGDSIAGNQFYNASAALSAGIRLLTVQVHDKDGTIELCHSYCELLDAGPLEDWLGEVSQWMSSHPHEVVTLIVVNSDEFTAAQLGAVFKSSGIDQYAYTPPTASSAYSWPTLRKMINSGERLVVFVASVESSSAYPYLLPEFDYVFETPYEVTELSGFNCTADRPSTLGGQGQAGISAGMLPLMNHFAYETFLGSSDILYPNVDDVATTNSPASDTEGALGRHADKCTTQWSGTKPTFILVDFFNKGPAITTADDLNGVTNAVGRKAVASPGDTVQGAATGAWDVSLPVEGLVLAAVGMLTIT